MPRERPLKRPSQFINVVTPDDFQVNPDVEHTCVSSGRVCKPQSPERIWDNECTCHSLPMNLRVNVPTRTAIKKMAPTTSMQAR